MKKPWKNFSKKFEFFFIFSILNKEITKRVLWIKNDGETVFLEIVPTIIKIHPKEITKRIGWKNKNLVKANFKFGSTPVTTTKKEKIFWKTFEFFFIFSILNKEMVNKPNPNLKRDLWHFGTIKT